MNGVIVSLMGKQIFYAPCKKHDGYTHGYLVLSCKRCVFRLATEVEIMAAGVVPVSEGDNQ